MKVLPILTTKIIKPLNKSLKNYDLEIYLLKTVCVWGVPNGVFFIAGWCEEAMKKVAMAGTTLRVGGAAFLHNVIMVFFLNHNATLCN